LKRKEETIGVCHVLIGDKPAHAKQAIMVDDLVPVFVVEVKGIEPLAPCMQSVLYRIWEHLVSLKSVPCASIVIHGCTSRT
jgi:hypothetical protein